MDRNRFVVRLSPEEAAARLQGFAAERKLSVAVTMVGDEARFCFTDDGAQMWSPKPMRKGVEGRITVAGSGAAIAWRREGKLFLVGLVAGVSAAMFGVNPVLAPMAALSIYGLWRSRAIEKEQGEVLLECFADVIVADSSGDAGPYRKDAGA